MELANDEDQACMRCKKWIPSDNAFIYCDECNDDVILAIRISDIKDYERGYTVVH